MARNAKVWFLLTYDVTDRRRIKRIHRSLLKHGIPVQRSVFLIFATRGQIEMITQQCVDILDMQTDELAVFRTNPLDSIWRFGVESEVSLRKLTSGHTGSGGSKGESRSFIRRLAGGLLWMD